MHPRVIALSRSGHWAVINWYDAHIDRPVRNGENVELFPEPTSMPSVLNLRDAYNWAGSYLASRILDQRHPDLNPFPSMLALWKRYARAALSPERMSTLGLVFNDFSLWARSCEYRNGVAGSLGFVNKDWTVDKLAQSGSSWQKGVTSSRELELDKRWEQALNHKDSRLSERMEEVIGDKEIAELNLELFAWAP